MAPLTFSEEFLTSESSRNFYDERILEFLFLENETFLETKKDITWGNDFFGLEPPILPGRIEPVSRYLKTTLMPTVFYFWIGQ